MMGRLPRIALLGTAMAIISACGGLPAHPSSALQAARERSWMLAAAQSEDLLYVAESATNEVDVLAYPSGKAVGKLTGFDGLAFLCADKSGDVFIPNYGRHQILEYAHGGTSPIAKLKDGTETPYSCALDPTSGNLAVANYESYSQNDVAIYEHAKGSPHNHSLDQAYFCTYDPKGNLFVEGVGRGSYPGIFLSRLPKGSRIFSSIALDVTPAYPNGLQWVANYLAIGTGTVAGPSTGDTYIYHVQIIDNVGRTIATTPLVETGPTNGFYIAGSTAIVTGGVPPTDTKLFAYPGGGAPKKSLASNDPAGVVVSFAKH